MKDKKEKAKQLIQRMEKERGFGRLWRTLLAERDPEFTELMHNKALHVFQDGALSRKMKEIICVCADAIQFYEPGVRIHLRNAIELGATEQEIIEALEAAIMPGIHPLTAFVPAIIEEFKIHKEGKTPQEIFDDKVLKK